MRRASASLLALAAAAAFAQPAGPAPAPAPAPALFEGADLALGEKLIAEHQCSACHQRRVGGDGSAIYRPAGRINTPGALRGMVDYCSTELNLGLFPEEVTAVAAVLQRDHYRFGATPAPR
jgi:mono/diheme cytochrome c family protein